MNCEIPLLLVFWRTAPRRRNVVSCEVTLSIDFSCAPTTARCFLDLSSRVHTPVRPAANRVRKCRLLSCSGNLEKRRRPRRRQIDAGAVITEIHFARVGGQEVVEPVVVALRHAKEPQYGAVVPVRLA
jgi:hypothetical protein